MYQTEGDSGRRNRTEPLLHRERVSRRADVRATRRARTRPARATRRSTSAPASAGTTRASTARPGSRTWSTSSARSSTPRRRTAPDGPRPGRLERPRGAALAGRRQHVHRPDRGRDVADEPQRAPPGPARAVTNPGNPLQFFEGSDGGLMLLRRHARGHLVAAATRAASTGAVLARCKQLLSAVPGELHDLNNGLQTLQFQSLSVNPPNPKNIQGGTQDNGTFETPGSSIDLAADDLRRRRPVGLRRDEPDTSGSTRTSRSRSTSASRTATPPSWDLDRRPAVRGSRVAVLLPDHHRPGPSRARCSPA